MHEILLMNQHLRVFNQFAEVDLYFSCSVSWSGAYVGNWLLSFSRATLNIPKKPLSLVTHPKKVYSEPPEFWRVLPRFVLWWRNEQIKWFRRFTKLTLFVNISFISQDFVTQTTWWCFIHLMIEFGCKICLLFGYKMMEKYNILQYERLISYSYHIQRILPIKIFE